ncbi:MAG TPA: twin-arginine translocase subunit TatC [Nocardioidaceae bacterium]|nr:twin-arginine translocase subunit TatC [Nocardioidaceae bacterium]
MSLSGVVGLFQTTPHNPVGDDGRMALADHLRELRARLLRIALVLVVGITVAWFFYDQLFSLLLDPYEDARNRLEAKGVDSQGVITGVATSLLLRLKISALAALVATSPYWLYQIWAFIVPGLHANEKRWTRLFAAVAGPLFIAGVATAYYVLPKGMEVLIGFTPGSLQSLVDFGDYFRFLTRMLLVFGIAFEIPLFVVMLSLAGVVSGKSLGAYRPWIVVGTFVFAAVATPSTDPFSMLMLALPMTLLFLISEGIARLIDRRRHRRAANEGLEGLSDDEASPLTYTREDVRASRLDEED